MVKKVGHDGKSEKITNFMKMAFFHEKVVFSEN